MLEFWDGDYNEWQAGSLLTRTCTNQTTSRLVCSLNIFGARTNHGQTWTHKTHHGLDLGEATTFPLIVFFAPSHGVCTQVSFCPETLNLGIPNFLKLGLLLLWKPITSCIDLWLRWGPKKIFSPHWELSNDMWHVPVIQLIHEDFWLLVVWN